MKKTLFLYLLLFFVAFVLGCAENKVALKEQETLASSRPEKSPDWVDNPAKRNSEKLIHFVGVSLNFAQEAQARDDSVDNARQHIAGFLNSDVMRIVQEVSSTEGVATDIIDPGIVRDVAKQIADDAIVTGAAANEFYVERWQKSKGNMVDYYWKSYVLIPFEKSKAEEFASKMFDEQAKKSKDEKAKQNVERARSRFKDFFGEKTK